MMLSKSAAIVKPRQCDLEASVLDTADKFLFQNWYQGTQYRVEQFNTTDGNKTLAATQQAFDTPVVSRVRLRPGQSWMFSTWALVPSTFDRQLEIEWRDPAMRVLSTARVANTA